MQKCLKFNPQNRLTIKEALNLEIFDSVRKTDLEGTTDQQLKFDFENIDFKTQKELRKYFIKEIFY